MQSASGVGTGRKRWDEMRGFLKSMSVVFVSWKKDGDYDYLKS